MADVIIPAPDANGYRHYIYITTDVDGRWYGGKRSTKKHPNLDPYKGSGNWVRSHPEQSRLIKTIVSFHPSSADAYAAERQMMSAEVVFGDPLCMNRMEGGEGMTVESALALAADPYWRAATLAGAKKRARNEAWKQRNAAALQRIHANPVVQQRMADANRRKAKDAAWLQQNATILRVLHKDPAWLASVAAAGVRRRNNPAYAMSDARGGRKRSADPAWREAQIAGCRKRSANPAWQDKHAQTLKRIHGCPKWKASQLVGGRKRATDPKWIASNAKVLERMNTDPEILAKRAAIAASPEVKAKVAAAAKRNWADPVYREKVLEARRKARTAKLAKSQA